MAQSASCAARGEGGVRGKERRARSGRFFKGTVGWRAIDWGARLAEGRD